MLGRERSMGGMGISLLEAFVPVGPWGTGPIKISKEEEEIIQMEAWGNLIERLKDGKFPRFKKSPNSGR